MGHAGGGIFTALRLKWLMKPQCEEADLAEIMGARIRENFAYIGVNRQSIVVLMTYDTVL